MANAENDRTCQKYLEVHSFKRNNNTRASLLIWGEKLNNFPTVFTWINTK